MIFPSMILRTYVQINVTNVSLGLVSSSDFPRQRDRAVTNHPILASRIVCMFTFSHGNHNDFQRTHKMPTAFQLFQATVDDLGVVSRLESSSFPADEAASPETIRVRHNVAEKYFCVIKKADVIDCIGFINATCIVGETVKEESMTDHAPEGKSLVIHSVTVSPEYRRGGVGSAMLKSYVNRIATDCPEIERLLLLSKAYLLGYYVSCGFQLIGLSSVKHGEVNETQFWSVTVITKKSPSNTVAI